MVIRKLPLGIWRCDLITNKKDTTHCNAVIICNGKYSKPNIPKIPGIETFPGRVLHSRSYRQPEDFANRTVVVEVVVLGDGDSGVDITADLISQAKKVYLSARHGRRHFADNPGNVEEVGGVVAANGSQLIFQDNSTIVADTFIFCTGYSHDFPFLDERSDIVVEKKQVRPLYSELINIEHPSMIIVGLPFFRDYGELYYTQIAYFLQVLLGDQTLPSYEDMLKTLDKSQ